MVVLNIDMGCGLMIREMTVSIRSSPISIWDILSLCCRPPPKLLADAGGYQVGGEAQEYFASAVGAELRVALVV